MSSPQAPGNLDPYAGYAVHLPDMAGSAQRSRKELLGRFKPSRTLGAGAGILAAWLCIFSLAGVVWGLFRPAYTASILDAESASVAASANVEFISFISFALVTAVLGSVMALVVFLRSAHYRGLSMLLWLTAVACVGSLVFLLFGDLSAGLMHRTPEDFSQIVGQTFTVVPPMSPGVGLLTAPFLAVCTYWCATFVTPVEDAGEAQEQ